MGHDSRTIKGDENLRLSGLLQGLQGFYLNYGFLGILNFYAFLDDSVEAWFDSWPGGDQGIGLFCGIDCSALRCHLRKVMVLIEEVSGILAPFDAWCFKILIDRRRSMSVV